LGDKVNVRLIFLHRPSQPIYVPKYRIAPKFDDPSPVPKKQPAQESSANHNHPNFTQNSKKKKSKEQCPIDEQNKAGIDELPDSSEFFYKLETKTARKAIKNVWKNPEVKKEVLAALDRMDKGKLLPRN
jgi:hypothetical protein